MGIFSLSGVQLSPLKSAQTLSVGGAILSLLKFARVTLTQNIFLKRCQVQTKKNAGGRRTRGWDYRDTLMGIRVYKLISALLFHICEQNDFPEFSESNEN